MDTLPAKNSWQENVPIQWADDREVWDRQPDESSKAWKAWCAYQEMDPFERSYRVVAKKLKVTDFIVARYAKIYRWQDRIEAYEVYLARRRRLKREQEILDSEMRHIRMGAQIAQKILQRIEGDDAEGVAAIDPNEWNAKDMAVLAQAFAKLERDALGLDKPVAFGGEEGIRLKVSFDTTPIYPDNPADHDVELPPTRMVELEDAVTIGPVDHAPETFEVERLDAHAPEALRESGIPSTADLVPGSTPAGALDTPEDDALESPAS